MGLARGTKKMNLNSWATEIESIQPGETIRVDHTECTAGEDTRRRLYLTRVLANPEVVVGYCHNCAEGGKHTDSKYTQYRDERHKKVGGVRASTKVYHVAPPDSVIRTLSHWPVHAQAWAMKNKLTQVDLNTYSIGHDTASDRVYIPRYDRVLCNIHNGGQALQGYQLRLTQGKGPKYTTVLTHDDKGYTVLVPYHGAPMETIVVVEDLVSGIHVINADSSATVSVLVNYGVKINPVAMPALTLYNKVVVWLDNDSAYVVEQGRKYARTVALYGTDADVVYNMSDPKHFSATDIMDAING